MVTLLARLFIKNREQLEDRNVRRAYGYLCSILGIVLNLLLSAAKFVVGHLSGSVAVIADAVNNLSDVASSAVTLAGFKGSAKHPDSEHPFGHGRIEYISGVVVALLVILMAAELLKSSVSKILHPAPIETSPALFLVLVLGILVKLYMAFYNRRLGKKLKAPAMKATALDSLSDVLATLVVLAATLLSAHTRLNVDGWGGLLVAMIVFVAGVRALMDASSPLLGNKPDEEFVGKVKEIVLREPHILGVHDIMVHDYGRGVRYVSLHAEVPGDMDVSSIHDEVDFAEHLLRKELECRALIHMDPVLPEHPRVKAAREKVEALVAEQYPDYEVQDVRLAEGEEKEMLVFEVDIPIHLSGREKEIRKELKEYMEAALPDFQVRVTIDHKYV